MISESPPPSNQGFSATPIILRPINLGDAEIYTNLRNSRNTYHWFFSARRFSLNEVRKWLKSCLRRGEEIYIAESGKDIVGTCSIYNIDFARKRAEVGRLIVCEEKRGQGFAVTSMKARLSRGIELCLNVISVNIKKTNIHSVRLVETVGFEHVAENEEAGYQYEIRLC